MLHTHTNIVEYYSAMKKKNEMMQYAATWMDLEINVLNEISMPEKDKYHISLICRILKNDTNRLTYKTETDSQTYKTKLRLQ